MTTQVCLVDSLTKVLPNKEPYATLEELSGLRGETVSFQLVWEASAGSIGSETDLRYELMTSASHSPKQPAGITVSKVNLVPVQVPWNGVGGDGFVQTETGLYPDLLIPCSSRQELLEKGMSLEGKLTPSHVGWNALWIDVQLPIADLTVSVWEGQQRIFTKTVRIRTVNMPIPKAELVNLQWVHCDGLADYYGIDVWSEDHWKAVAEHLRAAADMGVTGVLTPIWTPPLDQAIGTYRKPVQLLRIKKSESTYSFDFTLVDRWIELLQQVGITDIEVPHLYTQWGAKHCPQFWIEENGHITPKFGWEVDSDDQDYLDFLRALIPAVRTHLAERIGGDHVWFHISDEPSAADIATYKQATNQVSELLQGAHVIDALSDSEFIEHVATPVVATDAVNSFRNKGIEPQWLYYCVAQQNNLANRFIAQHGVYHRAIGFQLYKTAAVGFLHWGFNFYNTQFSLGRVDPFADTSAGGKFISGDAYVVYPGEDFRVLLSQRYRLIQQALADLSACQLAESLTSRDRVLQVIDPNGELDYSTGWVRSTEYLARRSRLNMLIEQQLH